MSNWESEKVIRIRIIPIESSTNPLSVLPLTYDTLDPSIALTGPKKLDLAPLHRQLLAGIFKNPDLEPPPRSNSGDGHLINGGYPAAIISLGNGRESELKIQIND